MCGIVAIFSRRKPIEPEVLARATDRLRHRGPDGEGFWISPDRRTGLGHRRLSIIDLATGDQPIASEDGHTRIVVNGEFYGYESIQRELEASGHRLRTRSDSEIALHLYEDLGVECLHRLRGEFAFVLWDERSRTVFAARDRFGIKPLFYAWHDDTLFIASEVKALFAAGLPARWDAESFYHALTSAGGQERTLFAGVLQIPPGHYMIATEKRVRISQYWDFNFRQERFPPPQRSDADWAAELRSALDEAVRIRLRADVPVACYLSGGIDSCAVLGLAARHHPRPIRAFNISFDDPRFDEKEIAREMAAKANAEFVSIPARQDDLADHFADAIEQAETLCNNAHGVAKYLLSRVVRDAGFKVVLTGEGADEILAGYPEFRFDMQRAGTPADPNGVVLPLDTVRKRLGVAPYWMEIRAAAAQSMQGFMAKEFLERFPRSDCYRALISEINVPAQLAGRHPLNQALYLGAKSRMPTYILTMLSDRVEMAHSVEGRLPFLDHHVVEVMSAQPVSQKIRGKTEKYVLREATRDVVSDTVYRRRKHPFATPPATLRRRERLNTLVQDMLRGPALAAIPYLDQKRIVALLDRLPSFDDKRLSSIDRALMRLASACVLQERYRLAT
ncbi:asparagine synthase (glutamine-hydrolyzing) [Taklimakanibacter deserti]|uniref:asparagine synthase (glutamine-hydrolyzing) n=1 Tax=Taklimakanibacter deserti TaxID=2267839 RepID=UPI000E64E7CD